MGNNGENGGRESGNIGKCKGGDWVNKGSYWAQPSCNTGANWFINKKMMGAAYDYEFSADQKNRDNDDSGFVFRFKDKNNFIRFHHTFRIVSKINGQVQVYIDKKLHMNVKLPSTYNLKVGTFGIFVAWSQIEFKNVQYKYGVDQPLS